jgi:thymidylate synthase
MMGVPPYQLFQLLPGKDKEVLSSMHWHRSLDASGGAQLDFNHDYNWLKLACNKTGRRFGSITIVVGNLHLYADNQSDAKNEILSNDNIKEKLKMWVDGYESGDGTPHLILQRKAYQINFKRAFRALNK